MPNWCENTLVVSGPKNGLDAFYEKIYSSGSGNFELFESFIPTPKELLEYPSPNNENASEMSEKHGASDWYEWRIDNWGIKWDCASARLRDHIKHEDNFETMVFIFDTPWSPPIIGLEQISRLCPTLRIYLEFKELGMGFQGYAQFFNGDTTEEQTVDVYKTTDMYLEDLEFVLFRDTDAENTTENGPNV